MKKLISMFIMVLLLCTAAVAQGQTAMIPGVYTETVKGIHEGMVVEIVLGEYSVDAITVLENNETVGIADVALATMPDRIVETQNLACDIVAGATRTSQGILDAVEAAIIEAGGKPEEFTHATEKEEEVEYPKMAFPEIPVAWDESYDVVVVGGGFAGMAAAHSAYEAGASVVLVEKMPSIGGNSAICGGEMAAWTSKIAAAIQDSQGYEADTASRHYEDTMTGGDNINDPELVKTMVKAAPYYVDVLIDNGMEFQNMLAMLGGHTGYRTYESINLVGTDYTSIQKKILEERNIPIKTQTRMTEIYRESDADQRVVGIKVQLEDGSLMNIEAKKGVIIATGGFGANVDLRVAQIPYLDEAYPTTNGVFATGDGIILAQAVGASTIQLDRIQRYPFADPETGVLDYAANIADSASCGLIYVDIYGKRYVNEAERRDVNSDAAMATGGTATFSIFSREIMEKVTDEALATCIADGRLYVADTIEELVVQINAHTYQGESISMDAETLKESIAKHNEYIKNGIDEEFGKTITPSMKPMEKGPYYALPQWPSVHHTMGGLHITANTEVMDIYQNVIPGLYAAGEVTGAVHGSNRLGSNGVTDACTFGYISGHVAATGETPTFMFEKYPSNLD